ncbi:MAG TPA: sialidase family protein [Gaiellaceae bacterium]|nr:sialidase family protein [Gaiellaceae bacterium]
MIVATVSGTFEVDLETGELEPVDVALEPPAVFALNLPRVVAAAAAGATVVAVVAAKPPLLVSHDAGSTWRAAGRGLPPGRAVAIDETDPDTIVYAARNRLYVSRNGGVFWTALAVELPEVTGISL